MRPSFHPHVNPVNASVVEHTVTPKLAPSEAKSPPRLSSDSARTRTTNFEPASYSGDVRSEFNRRPLAPGGDRLPIARDQSPRSRTDSLPQIERYDDIVDRLADVSLQRQGGRFTEQSLSNMKAIRRIDPEELARMRELRREALGDDGGGMERLHARRFDAAELARMRQARDGANGGMERLDAQRFTPEYLAKMRAERNLQNDISPVRKIEQGGAAGRLRQKRLPAVREQNPARPAFVGSPEHSAMMHKLFPNGLQTTASQKGAHFKQGQFGNCAVLSALQTTLMHQPQRIEHMLEPLKSGSGVRIHLGQPVNGRNHVDVTYDELAQSQFSKGVEGPPGIRLLERGLARAEKTGTGLDAATLNVLGNGRDPVTTLGFFGGGAKAMDIHGNPTTAKMRAGGNAANYWDGARLRNRADDTRAVLDRIGKNPKGTLAVAWTPTDLKDPHLMEEHAYAVKAFDRTQDKVRLVNPHDTSKSFELTTDEFLDKFFGLDYIDPK